VQEYTCESVVGFSCSDIPEADTLIGTTRHNLVLIELQIPNIVGVARESSKANAHGKVPNLDGLISSDVVEN